MNRYIIIFLSVSIVVFWLLSSSTTRNDLNSLFSGLAFAAIVYSLYEQGKEIKETKRQQEMANNTALLNLYQAMLDFYTRQKKEQNTSYDATIEDKIKDANKRIDDALKHLDAKYKII